MHAATGLTLKMQILGHLASSRLLCPSWNLQSPPPTPISRLITRFIQVLGEGGFLCTNLPSLLSAFMWGRVAGSSGYSPWHRVVYHPPHANPRQSLPIHSPHSGQPGNDVRAVKIKAGGGGGVASFPRTAKGTADVLDDLELEISLYCTRLPQSPGS